MYTAESFDERLANATQSMISGRPYLWDELGKSETAADAAKIAIRWKGNARVIDNNGREIARGPYELAALAAS